MLWFIRAAIRMITSHSDYLFPQATARHIRDEIFEILVRLTGDEGRVI